MRNRRRPLVAAGRFFHAVRLQVSSLKAQQSDVQPFLQLSNASVVLGGVRVLDNLTLSIDVGEHAAILGPNGAGKSTFMRLLTLQQYPLMDRDGQPPIRLFGRDRWNVFELRSQMGIVSADLHDRFVHGNSNGVVNALDAVASGFFATHGVFAHQRVTAAMRAEALEALDRVGAAALATRTLDTLSTGEARRVLIARALVHTPKVLVLDEPTRGLDLVARHAFMERVRDVARQGTTILLVTPLCRGDHPRDRSGRAARARTHRVRWTETRRVDGASPESDLRRTANRRTSPPATFTSA